MRTKEFSCVPERIMKPLQTTKATRYLCYKLIEDINGISKSGQSNKINTLYYNGKDGDFYLKASRDTLLLHCRDMAFIFGDPSGANELMKEKKYVPDYSK